MLDIIKVVNFLREQGLPIGITIITFALISVLLILFVNILNLFPFPDKILVSLKPYDILFGMTIYLKVSVDFAIFMGNLIKSNPGWKNRIAIELGTSIGNALGTILILTVWIFLRNVEILLVIMILISSLVLLKMAEEGIKDFLEIEQEHVLSRPLTRIKNLLSIINKLTHPFLRKILPEGRITGKTAVSFSSLVIFSFTVPFILGLDDFAGYIPLFSIINIVSFSEKMIQPNNTATTGLIYA